MPKDALLNKIPQLPKRPGIYKYLGKNGNVLYVGKALQLKERIKSYFQNDITPKTKLMLEEACDLTWIETGSDFEALLLEARLIKFYRPKYNVVFRDDKSYLYIFVTTHEEFPKVFLTRKPKVFRQGEYFGPFPSSRTARSLVKILRRSFPFCQQKSNLRPCFYSHIGLCNPCPATIVKLPEPQSTKLKRKYRKNIFRLIRILSGKFDVVKNELERTMVKLANHEQFEDAALIREQLFHFSQLLNPKDNSWVYLENPNFYFEKQLDASKQLVNTLNNYGVSIFKADKIECFDVSNLTGKYSVASCVVFLYGVPEKNLYRRFKIKIEGEPNDVGMLSEAIERRLNHKDWLLPDLLVVDGGKPQVATILKLLEGNDVKIPLIGLAKQDETIVIPQDHKFLEIKLSRKDAALQLLQQLRDESHRFALAYHRKRRNMLIF